MFPLTADPFLRVETDPRSSSLMASGTRVQNDQPQGKQQDTGDRNYGQVEGAFVSVTHANAFVHTFNQTNQLQGLLQSTGMICKV